MRSNIGNGDSRGGRCSSHGLSSDRVRHKRDANSQIGQGKDNGESTHIDRRD